MPLTVSVKVWGEWACFTRPELKVERLSYPLMTPSAARGVLDAILFRPQMRWHVRRIIVLEPWWLPPDNTRPHYCLTGFRRNEIQGKISTRTVSGWMADPSSFEPYLVDSAGRESIQGQNRTQRNTLALRDVAYQIDASPILTEKANQPRGKPCSEDEPEDGDTQVKYVAMFQRRVKKGQCFHRPYLGCREFACSFGPLDGSERPVNWNEDLGLMLYDIRFLPQGQHQPGFFPAIIRDGILHCDTEQSGPQNAPPVKVIGWDKETAA